MSTLYGTSGLDLGKVVLQVLGQYIRSIVTHSGGTCLVFPADKMELFRILMKGVVRHFIMNPDGRKGKTGKPYRQSQYTDYGLRFVLKQVAKSDFQIMYYHTSKLRI